MRCRNRDATHKLRLIFANSAFVQLAPSISTQVALNSIFRFCHALQSHSLALPDYKQDATFFTACTTIFSLQYKHTQGCDIFQPSSNHARSSKMLTLIMTSDVLSTPNTSATGCDVILQELAHDWPSISILTEWAWFLMNEIICHPCRQSLHTHHT